MFAGSMSSFFSGSGHVESLLRDFSWSESPLKCPDEWPQALQYAVRFLLDSKTAIYIAWGPELRLLYNDAYAEILGDRHPYALGQPLHLVWPEVWTDIQPLVEDVLSGSSFKREDEHFRIRRENQDIDTWFTFSFTQLRDLAGNVHGFYCILSETSEQVKLRRRRQNDSDRIYRLFERSSSFMAVLEGPDLRYSLANPAYFRLVGKRELLGRTIHEVFPEIRDQGYFELFERVYATGEPFAGTSLSVALDRSGTGELETLYIDFVLEPIHDEHDRISGLLIEGYDVTSHVRAQERVLQSEILTHEATIAQEEARVRLEALLEAAPVGIAFADMQGKLTLVNAENRRIWGEHPMSEDVDDYIEWKGWWADGSARHGEPISPEEWGLARALNGEDAISDVIEIEPFGSPGVRRILLLRAAPVRNSNGEIINAVVAQTDITERVRSESALRESEERFRTIANAMPQMVWSTRPDGYHDYYNHQWYEFTGVPRGTTDGEGWNDMFHPDDQKRSWDAWTKSLATGDTYEIEYRLRHHTGLYRWVLGRALPVRNEHGKITRWMGTCTDIHEQKMAQVAVQDNEERFRALADNIPQLAWMADKSGNIFWYNNRWYDYTGEKVDQLDGFISARIHHPDHFLEVTRKFADCVGRGEIWEDTFPLKKSCGNYHWFLSRAVPIYDSNGEVSRWLGTSTDVTEQREAADSLRQMDKRKDEFLAMLAHELRNPLAPITTAANLLLATRPDSARLKQISSVIARQAVHMTTLINDLLDVSRVTRGLIALETADVDMNVVIADAVEQAKPLIDARAHTLTVNITSESCVVKGDQKRLVQAVTNILNNAAKYTPVGGAIAVDTLIEGSSINISIADNGVGMSKEVLTHAFDLFTQAQRTPDRAQGGLGIGLALVKSIIQLHGGYVRAVSEGAGKGCTFTVSLPRSHRIEPTTLPNEESIKVVDPHTPLRVLVVDDNEDAAQTLASYLQVVGHEVWVEYSASGALARAQAVLPNVCLLDIGLPDMDGKELAKRIRSNPALASIKLAAVTGYGQVEEREAVIAAGIDEHFVKPLDIAALNAWLYGAGK